MASLGNPLVEECAKGVYRLGTTYVGFYLLFEGGKYTLVDSGLPGYWDQLTSFLDGRGHSIDDIEAQILTHHHMDHRGNSERLREAGAPARIHHIDAPFLENEAPPPKAPLWRLPVLRYLGHLVKNKAMKTQSLTEYTTYDDDELLEVPGRPRVVHVPGHTMGHCSMYLGEQKAVLAGDALGGMDAYTEAIGPCLAPSFVNDDDQLALESLTRLESLDADKVLVVHGPNFNGPIAEAVALARKAAAA